MHRLAISSSIYLLKAQSVEGLAARLSCEREARWLCGRVSLPFVDTDDYLSQQLFHLPLPVRHAWWSCVCLSLLLYRPYYRDNTVSLLITWILIHAGPWWGRTAWWGQTSPGWRLVFHRAGAPMQRRSVVTGQWRRVVWRGMWSDELRAGVVRYLQITSAPVQTA